MYLDLQEIDVHYFCVFDRDHKTLFVSDARGRIFSWIVSDNPGRTNVDHWIQVETVGACKDCLIRFLFAERCCHLYSMSYYRVSVYIPFRVSCSSQLSEKC